MSNPPNNFNNNIQQPNICAFSSLQKDTTITLRSIGYFELSDNTSTYVVVVRRVTEAKVK